MSIPESNEVQQHRGRETHRDNVLSYWLFLPAMLAAVAIIVMAITQSGGQFIPVVVGALVICMGIGASYRRGWKAGVLMLVFIFVMFGLVVVAHEGMFALLRLLAQS